MKKTPNMREYLRKSGVKPRDLREAVDSARFVTEQTEIYSGIAEEILSRIATHPRVGNRTKRIFVVAARTAATMKMASAAMLQLRGRAEDVPPRAPLRRKKESK